jgi:multiple sugar transport system substrate-binding protein
MERLALIPKLFAAAGIVVAALLLSAPAMPQSHVPGTFPPIKAGKPYAGVTITIPTMQGWASFQPAIAMVKEFEDMTGIKVKFDYIPGGEIPTKQLLEVSRQTGTYDLVQQHGSSFAHFFRYLHPLDGRIKETWGSVEAFDQWVFPAQQGVRGKDGHHYFVPFHANVQIGMYRKALFEDQREKVAFKAKYGYDLAPPKTIKQVEDIAVFFTRPDKGMYGLAANWGTRHGFQSWLDYFHSAGFWQLDQGLRPTFTAGPPRETAIQIARWMIDAVYTKKFANPDSANFLAGQVNDYFLSGASAMAWGWLSDYWLFMQDPKNIKNVGPVGSFRFPSFTGSDAGGFSSWWVMGLNKDSKNPDAAWEFVKWTLNEKPQRAMAGGQLPPIRDLAYATSIKPGGINPPALYEAFTKAVIVHQVPEMAQAPYNKGVDLFSALIARKMTPEEFLDQYAAAIVQTLEKAGYYKK